MPRKRLPWFKLWGGSTRHEKIAALDDHEFRVWVELLDAASEQKIRGVFASLKVAAAVIRRQPIEVQALVDQRLVDVDDDGAAVMHDWQIWQRWYAEPGDEDELDEPPPSNGNGTARESHANNTAITREQPAIDAGMALARVAETGELKTGDVKDEETLRPETKESPPRARPRTREGPGHVDEVKRARQRSRRGGPGVAAKVRDAFEVGGTAPVMTARDERALASYRASPELVVEVYDAIATGEYGNDYFRTRLSVCEVLKWINGYIRWRLDEAMAAGHDAYMDEKRRLDMLRRDVA